MAASTFAFPLVAVGTGGASGRGAAILESVEMPPIAIGGAGTAAGLMEGASASTVGRGTGSLGWRLIGGGTNAFGGMGAGFGGGGSVGREVAFLATKSGIDTSRGSKILGAGTKIDCVLEIGLGEVAIMACFDSSMPRGVIEVPILLTGATSGSALRRS